MIFIHLSISNRLKFASTLVNTPLSVTKLPSLLVTVGILLFSAKAKES